MKALPIRAVIPGLVYVVVLDLSTVAGWLPEGGGIFLGWPWVLAALPWVTLLVLRRPTTALGYARRRFFAEYGWGMVAGALWRGLSMAFNLFAGSGSSQLGWGEALIGGLVWVPLFEETFFRGYLGRALAARWGKPVGITVQAALFALTPVHWAQGWIHLISIFGFGLLTGWLVEVRRSIWPALGAHGFANVLPWLLPLLA